MKTFCRFLLTALIAAPTVLSAQTTASDPDLLFRKFRVSIVPGLSTNGLNAPQYSAKYSLNIIAGNNGGLDGYELGLVNINQRYARGFQAGLLNVTGGDMSGVNFAGLLNTSGGPMQGIQGAGIMNISQAGIAGMQFAGIGNIAGQSIEGIQAAGIFNIGGSSLEGLQFAGIMNISGGEIAGLQGAGVMNISRMAMNGLQVAGSVNIAGGSLEGLQLAGGANIAGGNMEGLQLSGGVNIARTNMEGLQLAGGANIARFGEGLQIAGGANISQTFEGLQISGFLNYAARMEGVQIGVLNLARDFEGVPLGLISLYGNGRKNLDIWVNEAGFVHAGFKTGTEEVYNMISVGYNPAITDRDVLSLGWTIGRHRSLTEAWNRPGLDDYFVNADLSFTKIVEGDDLDNIDKLNNLFTWRYLMGRTFGDNFSVYAGPSLNVLVSEDARNDDYTAYTIFERSTSDYDVKGWIGFTFGMQLF
jgi:hypothetical protein